MPSFGPNNMAKLNTCDCRLVELFVEVVKERNCIVLEGKRSPDRQALLYAEGVTQTMNSKHLNDPSRAVDVMPYPLDYDDRLGQHEFAAYVYYTAIKMGIKVRWGGNFKTLYDAPHWEIIL